MIKVCLYCAIAPSSFIYSLNTYRQKKLLKSYEFVNKCKQYWSIVKLEVTTFSEILVGELSHLDA